MRYEDDEYYEIAGYKDHIKNLEISLENRLQELTRSAAAYRELEAKYVQLDRVSERELAECEQERDEAWEQLRQLKDYYGDPTNRL